MLSVDEIEWLAPLAGKPELAALIRYARDNSRPGVFVSTPRPVDWLTIQRMCDELMEANQCLLVKS